MAKKKASAKVIKAQRRAKMAEKKASKTKKLQGKQHCLFLIPARTAQIIKYIQERLGGRIMMISYAIEGGSLLLQTKGEVLLVADQKWIPVPKRSTRKSANKKT